MDWVWTKSKSKGVGRLVMLALADKAIPAAGECKAYGSQRWLASQANCTQEAVTEALPVLYKLGELEIIDGQTGPYGATYYRLPKAIDHERPIAGNRSAHSVDSTAKGSKKSTGSLGHPATGSLGRSEAESTGSAGHITNPPPKTTTSASPDPSASPAFGGGGGVAALQQAEAFLGSLPGNWSVGRTTAAKLAPLLLEAITAQGWQLDHELAKKLTEDRGRVKTYLGALEFRINDLPKKPTMLSRDSPAAFLPRWCGECNDGDDAAATDPARRFHHTDTGSRRCACHPASQKAA